MSLNAGARMARVHPSLIHRAIRGRPSPSTSLQLRLPPSPSPCPSNALLRCASTSSTSQAKPTDSSLSTLSDPLNPPASTRPPPLDLPIRDPGVGLVSHLFKLGKAYTTFYKTGLKAVFTNRRLLRDLPDTRPPGLPSPSSSSPSQDKTTTPTRAALLLRARVRHDSTRLPLFGLVMLFCGEFTPLIVLLFPRLTPYTCRIPAQAAVIRRSVETRRAASFRALAHAEPGALAKLADGHVCRSLGLGSALWDRAGFDVPFAGSRARDAVQGIVRDDALLRSGGGVQGLVDDEVVLACEERGIDTLDKDVVDLRQRLEAWVEKSAPSQAGDASTEAAGKVRGLLLGLDGPI